VTCLRRSLFAHRRWAAALLVLALLAKLLVPAGFMPSVAAGGITVELCSGYGVEKVAMALPGLAGHEKQPGQHGKADSPCTFAGLTAPSLAGADPIILAVAIAFIVATVFRAEAVAAMRSAEHLRPPLRGPPATA
jgi:hypothetical protein